MAEHRAFSQMRCCLVTGKVSQKCLAVIQQRLQEISHQDMQFFVTSPSDQDLGASKPPNVVLMITIQQHIKLHTSTISDETIYCSAVVCLPLRMWRRHLSSCTSSFFFCRIMPAFKEWCVRNPWEDLMSPASCLGNTARMSRCLRSQGPSRRCMVFLYLNISDLTRDHIRNYQKNIQTCFESTSVGPMWSLSSGHREAISPLGHESFLRISDECEELSGPWISPQSVSLLFPLVPLVPVVMCQSSCVILWPGLPPAASSAPDQYSPMFSALPRVDSPIGDSSGSEILFWLRDWKILKLSTWTH